MAKTKTEKFRSANEKVPASRDDKKGDSTDSQPPDGGWRETVESVAMAVVLALLFRGFVAEAFVIPTGSMAPTLDGRHKDVWCSKCNVQYQVSASDEHRDEVITGLHVSSTTCPICRYTQTLQPLKKPNQASFSGDRVIVGKFAYDLAEPERWDVIVFKYPKNAVQNYIKRLIGLPNEKVSIVGGNIYTCDKDAPDEALKIARKPPHKLDELLQIVDDTGHLPKDLTDVGWPSRWQKFPADSSGWDVQDGGRLLVTDGSAAGEAWLRYRHLAPQYEDWRTIELEGKLPLDIADRKGELIADYYSYNTPHYVRGENVPLWRFPATRPYRPPGTIDNPAGPGDPPNYPHDLWRRNYECFGQHWVDDLALDCTAEITNDQGQLALMIVRGGVQHICRIDVATGKATLSMTDVQGRSVEFVSDDGQVKATAPTAATAIRGRGRYDLRLSNCDHEMLLWVNGDVVKFDGPTTYESPDLLVPYYTASDPGDLAPAGIGSRGVAVKLSRLKIFRDKYYIACRGYTNSDYDRPLMPERIQDVFRQPEQWEPSGLFAHGNRGSETFRLEADQFLPLGDNSPQSSDARYWDDHHYVERDLLIGKALLIYWPHTWNRPVPFTPNLPRMGPIR